MDATLYWYTATPSGEALKFDRDDDRTFPRAFYLFKALMPGLEGKTIVAIGNEEASNKREEEQQRRWFVRF